VCTKVVSIDSAAIMLLALFVD